MKTKIKELKNNSVEVLKKMQSEEILNLFKLKQELALRKLKNTQLIREKRKLIAQIATLIHQKETEL